MLFNNASRNGETQAGLPFIREGAVRSLRDFL